MDYKILKAKSLESFDEAVVKLEREVRKELHAGWKFQGGVSVSTVEDTRGNMYLAAQAIVKE